MGAAEGSGGGARRGGGRLGEHGQVLPLMAATLVVAGVLAIGVVHLAIAATERARAQSGADAAALAAAAEDRAAAVAAAAANGGQLEALRTVGDDVIVRVRFRRATARARARLVPDGLSDGSPTIAVGTSGSAGP